MTDWVVDANVLITANGANLEVALGCREAALTFVHDVLTNSHRVGIDMDGEIMAEYRRYCSPSGQPGVGDRFLAELFRSHPEKVVRFVVSRHPDREYVEFPDCEELQDFDRADRKYVAVARVMPAIVANAVDSDWHDFDAQLAAEGIQVHFVCGRDREHWFSIPRRGG